MVLLLQMALCSYCTGNCPEWTQWLKVLSSVSISPVSGCSPVTIPQLPSLWHGPDAICLLLKGLWDAQMRRRAEEVAGIADTPPNTQRHRHLPHVAWRRKSYAHLLVAVSRPWDSGTSPSKGVERQGHLLWDANDETSVLMVSITASPGDPFSPRGPFSRKKKSNRERELCNREGDILHLLRQEVRTFLMRTESMNPVPRSEGHCIQIWKLLSSSL